MKRLILVCSMALLVSVLLACCGAPPTATEKEPTSTPSTAQTNSEASASPTVTPSISVTETQEVSSPSAPETVHEHKYSPDETVQPTCTEDGYTVYACECGDSYTDGLVEKLGHNYEKADTVTPTKDAEGYTIYVCKECFHSKRDDYVPPIEEGLSEIQRNSINMLNYLAMAAERIAVSSGNRLVLEEVGNAFRNEILPDKVDDNTKEYFGKMRDIIYALIDTEKERGRLEYLHNQDKGAAIHSAVPNPLSILSIANSLDWKKLVTSVVFTFVDSYNKYATQVESVGREYIIGTWELDDAETDQLRANRDQYFDYMQSIVNEYQIDGSITLNEESVKRFVEISENDDVPSKVQFLESEQKTYEHFANYWLELADCYYELQYYEKCLSCIEAYKGLSVDIFRKDYDYAKVLPKVIVAAQMTKQSTAVIEAFAEDLKNNAPQGDWASLYFAAQVYVDLYSQTLQKSYLETAYDIALNNVNELVLKKEQQALNSTYLADIKYLTLDKPDYSWMSAEKKKEAENKYKEEKKYVDSYNKALDETRKTELPPLYEPLVVNCDLLFAVAEKLNISNDSKAWIENLLKTKDNGVFLSDAINNRYSFNKRNTDYTIVYDADSIEIPANLLTQGAVVNVQVKTPLPSGKSRIYIFDDWTIVETRRNETDVESFTAYYSNKKVKDMEWSAGTEVIVSIYNGAEYEPLLFRFIVTEFKYQFPLGQKPVFERR